MVRTKPLCGNIKVTPQIPETRDNFICVPLRAFSSLPGRFKHLLAVLVRSRPKVDFIAEQALGTCNDVSPDQLEDVAHVGLSIRIPELQSLDKKRRIVMGLEHLRTRLERKFQDRQ